MAGSNVNRGPFGRAIRIEDLVVPDGRLLGGRALRILTLVVGLATSLVTSVAAAETVTLRWFGHAYFVVTSPEGVRVTLDPYGNIGYAEPGVAADVVTVSHEHGDHNGADGVAGSPVILRGLKAGGADWNSISYATKDVRITSLPAYHDDVKGLKRGLNTIFIVETGGLRLAHLSDIGHTLPDATIKAMGRIDVLLVPVGGNFSINGLLAKQIMNRLQPSITIPIHYKTPVTADWPIEDESDFLAGLTNVTRLDVLEISLTPETLPTQPEVWVMRYE